MKLQITLALVLNLFACTEKNPALCTPDSPCSDGLICRGNQCVAETCMTSQDCEAGAPFCSTGGLCAMTCSSDTECPGYAGSANDLYCESGGCVECRMSEDCQDIARPICGASGQCQACIANAECASSLCGGDGTCVPEMNILFVDPTGIDAGDCAAATPCRSWPFALSRASGQRNNILLRPGLYVGQITLNRASTSVTSFNVFGDAAVVQSTPGFDSPLVSITPGFTDVEITGVQIVSDGGGVSSGSPLGLHHLKISGVTCVDSDSLSADDLKLGPCDFGIITRHQLAIDRVEIGDDTKHPYVGIDIRSAAIQAKNVLIHDTDAQCVTADAASSGTISFSTFVNCGLAPTSTSPKAINCQTSSMSLQSSIVWGPTTTSASVAGCNLSNMIIGQTAVTGADSQDPMFVDVGNRNYRLKSNSPAIDKATAGPSQDLDNNARPQGVRFDLGAYEYKP